LRKNSILPLLLGGAAIYRIWFCFGVAQQFTAFDFALGWRSGLPHLILFWGGAAIYRIWFCFGVAQRFTAFDFALGWRSGLPLR
jgi:hypothetical protein